MDLWLIILLSALGGFLLLVFIILTVWKLCKRRKRSTLPKLSEGQNGHVWQSHDHVIDVNDEESPSKRLHEDGLCKDTLSGSTFPRRGKKEEETEPEEDGLCKETKIRSTKLPRRGKLEEDWIKPVDNGGPAASEATPTSAYTVEALSTTIAKKENADGENNITHLGDANIEDQSSHNKDMSSSASSSSNEREKKNTAAKEYKLMKLDRKRSKSFHSDLDEVPLYTKPIKRAVSNPSIIAREEMLKADQRFESLKTWKESFPIPEPDYPSARYPPLMSKQMNKDDHVSLSNATRDFYGGRTESISEIRGGSEARSDSALELPGITMPQSAKQNTEEGSSLAQEQRSTVNVETKQHKNYIDGGNDNKVIIPIENEPTHSQNKVLLNSLKNSISNHPVVAEPNSVVQQQTTKITTENHHTTGSLSSDQQTVDFKSINHNRETTMNYQTNQDQVSKTSSTPILDSNAKRSQPSGVVIESQPPRQAQAVQATDSTRIEKTATNVKTIKQDNYSGSSTNNHIDFRAFKLRSTPDSIKQSIGFKEEPKSSDIQPEKIPVNDSGSDEKRVETTPLSNINRFQGINLSKQSEPASTGPGGKSILNQTASEKANGTIANSRPSTVNSKTSDMVIISLNEKEEPTQENPTASSNESTSTNHRRNTSGGVQSQAELRRNWRREQIEQRLSTGLALNQRQPIMQASGLAYKNCMPELFTKIKEIGDQKQEVKAN